MKKLILILFLLFSATAKANCIDCSEKSFIGVAGRIIGEAIVTEIIHAAVTAPKPTPTARPDHPQPIAPSNGADPRPEPCPSAGSARL